VWVQFPFCWGHLPLLSPVSPRSRPEFFLLFFSSVSISISWLPHVAYLVIVDMSSSEGFPIV
jgi:hypothetical protein